jgi:uncharacterized protein (TIGR02646 family)
MKRCCKLTEPVLLTAYRGAKPNATWEEMRDDPHDAGIQAAKDVKTDLVRGQRCLCAFCECSLATECSNEAIIERRAKQRVEHFHPKADPVRPPNWNLHWPNLWAVCLGGSDPTEDERNSGIHPLPQNLSCDAFKDHQIKTGKLSADPEGWILSPDEIPAFPLLFKYSPDGVPEPDEANCQSVTFGNNNYGSSRELVERTIEHLNLGCFRLAEKRRIAKAQLEKRIKNAREASKGAPMADVMKGLARRLFASDVDSSWPEFFSLVRWRLGPHAEEHLQEIVFRG